MEGRKRKFLSGLQTKATLRAESGLYLVLARALLKPQDLVIIAFIVCHFNGIFLKCFHADFPGCLAVREAVFP